MGEVVILVTVDIAKNDRIQNITNCSWNAWARFVSEKKVFGGCKFWGGKYERG